MTASAPQLGVIIPVFNRPELLRYSLESLRAAIAGIPSEIIVVDDGSEQRPDAVVADYSDLPIRLLRQANAGSIPARNTGFQASTAPFIQFLDSDDMVAPEKFRAQLGQLESTGADVSYCDAAAALLDRPYAELRPVAGQPFSRAETLAEFCFRAQPNPHAPLYRRTLLAAALRDPIVPPARRFDPVGDVWVYYNLATLPGKIVKLDRPWAIVGGHPGPRYTRHWEVLGAAGWHMMVEFDRRCPRTPATLAARRLFGETCLATWRALPRNFDATMEASLLAMWRASPPSPPTQLGGKKFAALAALLGVERTATLLRRWQRPVYAKIATLPPGQLRALLNSAAATNGGRS